MAEKKIIFTVTNHLVFDQRMQKIAGSLQRAGFEAVLVGSCNRQSPPLVNQPFQQHRLPVGFKKGPLFYLEFNLKLAFWLLRQQRISAICAIDLDTIIPVWLACKFKKTLPVYDAHELFIEMKEVVTRPRVHAFWRWVERTFVPAFTRGYTVNLFLQQYFKKTYGVQYGIVENRPVFAEYPQKNTAKSPFLLYQGAVNHGRSFETLVPAMRHISIPLVVCGDGNFMPQLKELINKYELNSKIELRGMVLPAQLKAITPNATIGLTLFENLGLNQIHSLANRFFDYIMCGVPQICVAYPEYEAINKQHQVALLIPDTQPETIAHAVNKLLNDSVLYTTLQNNCLQAAKQLSWQYEEEKLITMYTNWLA
jgi:glycosyltransferase involved in cell wall biosynthesis